jgi:hypothetical protein
VFSGGDHVGDTHPAAPISSDSGCAGSILFHSEASMRLRSQKAGLSSEGLLAMTTAHPVA